MSFHINQFSSSNMIGLNQSHLPDEREIGMSVSNSGSGGEQNRSEKPAALTGSLAVGGSSDLASPESWLDALRYNQQPSNALGMCHCN